MKYKRLTKEQFESLQTEFATFLATQSIDKLEWDEIKLKRPQVAEQELDVFSDLIWEGVLTKARFLEHFSSQHIFLFHCQENFMQTLVIKTLNPAIDFLKTEGLQWLGDHVFTPEVEIHSGKKEFGDDRNLELFNLILQGAILSDGQLYIQLQGIIEP